MSRTIASAAILLAALLLSPRSSRAQVPFDAPLVEQSAVTRGDPIPESVAREIYLVLVRHADAVPAGLDDFVAHCTQGVRRYAVRTTQGTRVWFHHERGRSWLAMSGPLPGSVVQRVNQLLAGFTLPPP